MNDKPAHNLTASQPQRERTVGYLGWLEDEWDEDHLASIEGGELGYPREDLRLAEDLYSPDLSDDILLRLYNFVMSHGDDEPGIWSVIRLKIRGLLLSRLPGGPQERNDRYRDGFDPEDHALAVEAIINDGLPHSDLLTLFIVACANKDIDEDWNDDTIFAPQWSAVLDLVRDRIIALMAAFRAGSGATSHHNSAVLNGAFIPPAVSGEAL